VGRGETVVTHLPAAAASFTHGTCGFPNVAQSSTAGGKDNMAEPQAVFTHENGRPCVIGEVDFTNADEFERWLKGFDESPLHIDLSRVTFFDSSALRTLLNAARQDESLRVVEPSLPVARLFVHTGVYDRLIGEPWPGEPPGD
jgi:anti-anti-sigma factor